MSRKSKNMIIAYIVIAIIALGIIGWIIKSIGVNNFILVALSTLFIIFAFLIIFFEKFTKALRLLVTNPKHFWQHIKSRVLTAKSGIIQINGINFNVDIDLDPAMHSMYFSIYEPKVTDILKRSLRHGDTFIDVGANVGYISAFALGLVGKTGSIHSFEPVPQFFRRLQRIKNDNPGYNIFLNNTALGEHDHIAQISVTNLNNIGWNTMVPGFMSQNTVKENLWITVTTLDHYVFEHNMERINLVKIDTEGYEFQVIKGFQHYLRSVAELPILVVEIAPAAYPLLNSSLAEFSDFMQELGYVAKSEDLENFVKLEEIEKTTNVVFLPALQFKNT